MSRPFCTKLSISGREGKISNGLESKKRHKSLNSTSLPLKYSDNTTENKNASGVEDKYCATKFVSDSKDSNVSDEMGWSLAA